MATADVYVKDGVERRLGGDTYATIHVSKISQGYTDDVSKELRKGDYIRARVTAIKPALQLTTKDDHLGVIRAQCSKCKTEMIRSKKGDGLYCPECKYAMPRKLADDYGDVEL
jgi:exosome complex component CSL4